MTSRRRTIWAIVVGLVTAVVTLVVAELVSLFVDPASGPLVAVGSWVIDIVPPWVKDTAIALFGTNDKIVLLGMLGLLVAILAAGVGWLELRFSPWGVVGLVLVGVIAGGAAVTRAGATLDWAVPTAIGLVAGAFVLRMGTDRLRLWSDATARDETPFDEQRAGTTRRGFLTVLGVAAVGTAIAVVAGQAVRAATSAANAVREAIALPRPTTVAPPIPAGAELGIRGLAPIITPNDNFYRIDTALQVPNIDPATWRLRVTGMVEEELELTFEELLALPLSETVVTLTCVSNPVGGDLIGNALWMGYPIRELLARARPLAGADMVLSSSIDGFTASTPLEALQDENRDAILAVSMNGEPLPLQHGFPVRMVVAGLYGYVSATKWLTELRLTRFEDETAYWTDRGWSAEGPIKTSSRIDVPGLGSQIPAGPITVAGVAWAQHTGIERVQVRVGDGAWADATLADAISIDTWVQWSYEWDASPGTYDVQVRATDSSGFTQSELKVPVVPDGAEGWHAVRVVVT